MPLQTNVTAQIRRFLRWGIGALMIWAALGKIANPQEFLVSIYGYELPLSESLLRATAVALPWLELICGLALIAGIWNESALAVLAALMVVFVLATGQAWIRGLDISCGCFGTTLEKDSFLGSVSFAFFRNLALLGVLAFLCLGACREAATTVKTE